MVFFGLALLSTCALYTSTNFSRFQGSSEYIGNGGTAKTVNGIDVWTYGEPNRRFRVLGIIDQSYHNNRSIMARIAGASLESDLVACAKEHGGDAIIYIGSDTVIDGFKTTAWASGQTVKARTRATTETSTKVAVIKYLD